MKKIIFLSLILLTLSTNRTYGQNEPKNTNYCILQVYGTGHNDKYKGAFIIYEDLKVEKKNLEDNSPSGVLKLTMENVSTIKGKGYVLISSSMATSSSGQIFEYIFKKE